MGHYPVQFNLLDVSLRRDIASNNDRLLWGRWAAGGLIVLTTAVCVHLLKLPLPELPLYIIGAVVLAYNALLTVFTRHLGALEDADYLRRIQQVFLLQVALDWVSMLFFVHMTGGITSPAIPFFFLHVIMVTMILPGQSPYIYCGIAVAVIGLIQLLEVAGILPHHTAIPGFPPDLHRNPVYALAQGAFFAVTITATAFLTSSIMGRLRERDRQIAVLLQTTEDVTSTLDLATVLERLARSAAGALFVRAASIRLLDEESGTLQMTASYGLSKDYIDKGPVLLENSELDREALNGNALIIRDPAHDPRLQYPQEIAAEGIHSMLVVPILRQGRGLGVLRVYSDEAGSFSPEDADFVMAIARQGATAIENALAHDTLQKADQERAQFVRIVTHELRAPVTGAQSLLNLLLRGMVGELSEQQRDIVTRLDRRLSLLLTLISDLLAFAAGRAVTLDDPLGPVHLCQVVEAVIDKLGPSAKDKQIALVYEPTDQPPLVDATTEGLTRIMDNLIGNAIKYTPEEGSVTVSVRRDGTQVAVAVADTGIGIPEDALEKLGEEFFRAPNALQSGIMGTGLGLAIVRQLVDRFHGTLNIESTEGLGTTFTVTLPVRGGAES